jgi:hypothetical protein
MPQIDLEPRQHSTHIEVVKTPKRLFFTMLAIWIAGGISLFFALDQHWASLCYGGLGVIVGIGWVTAYPEYHMRRLKD